MIVCTISLDKAKHIFYIFKASFIKYPKIKNVKNKRILLFLQKSKYFNKIMYFCVKFYPLKRAVSPVATKSKAVLQISK